MTRGIREQIEERHKKGESLAGIEAQGADLSRLDLHKGDFRGAKLRGTDFSRGDLSGSDFSGADLREANFRNSFLNDCNLEGADLSGADLRFCKLTGAKLEGTNFRGALYDRMTRFDPGVVKPFDVMVKKDASTGIFLTKEPPKEEK